MAHKKPVKPLTLSSSEFLHPASIHVLPFDRVSHVTDDGHAVRVVCLDAALSLRLGELALDRALDTDGEAGFAARVLAPRRFVELERFSWHQDERLSGITHPRIRFRAQFRRCLLGARFERVGVIILLDQSGAYPSGQSGLPGHSDQTRVPAAVRLWYSGPLRGKRRIRDR